MKKNVKKAITKAVLIVCAPVLILVFGIIGTIIAIFGEGDDYED